MLLRKENVLLSSLSADHSSYFSEQCFLNTQFTRGKPRIQIPCFHILLFPCWPLEVIKTVSNCAPLPLPRVCLQGWHLPSDSLPPRTTCGWRADAQVLAAHLRLMVPQPILVATETQHRGQNPPPLPPCLHHPPGSLAIKRQLKF